MTIEQDLSKDAVDSPLVELYTIDLNPIGVAEVFYLTPNTSGGTSIVFDGHTYLPFPIASSGWETSIDGKQPQPTLTLSNVSQYFNSYIAAYGDLVGARVTRAFTLEKYLGAVSPQSFGTQTSVVYQLQTQSKNVLEFKLASLIDRAGRKFPNAQVLRKEFPGAGLLRRS